MDEFGSSMENRSEYLEALSSDYRQIIKTSLIANAVPLTILISQFKVLIQLNSVLIRVLTTLAIFCFIWGFLTAFLSNTHLRLWIFKEKVDLYSSDGEGQALVDWYDHYGENGLTENGFLLKHKKFMRSAQKAWVVGVIAFLSIVLVMLWS